MIISFMIWSRGEVMPHRHHHVCTLCPFWSAPSSDCHADGGHHLVELQAQQVESILRIWVCGYQISAAPDDFKPCVYAWASAHRCMTACKRLHVKVECKKLTWQIVAGLTKQQQSEGSGVFYIHKFYVWKRSREQHSEAECILIR